MSKVKYFICGEAQENTYIFSQNNQALIIDPGGEHPSISDYIEMHHLQVQAILLTHCHYDHIAGVDGYAQKYGVPVYIHELDAPGLQDPKQNLSVLLTHNLVVKTEATVLTKKSGQFTVGDLTISYLLLPGHSLGSVAYILDKDMFSGDVLFDGSVGRYDFPFCSVTDLGRSLEQIFALDEAMTVYPGHGPATTVGREKTYNTVAQTIINYRYNKRMKKTSF